MPTVYKVLGQSNPAATTLTTLYTVPALTSAIISTLTAANLTTASVTYRIAIRPAGAAVANLHYLAYDVTLLPNTTQTMTLGITLAATDVVSVYASATGVAFHAYGSELS
jgi:hypothetical protein